MVVRRSKKTGEGKKNKTRSDPVDVEKRLRGPYMRGPERRALLEADPHCDVLSSTMVKCLECGTELRLDRRAKSMSAPTGGYYGSNWRKHWTTHLKPKKFTRLRNLRKEVKSVREGHDKKPIPNPSPITSPLFLPDSVCGLESGYGTPFDRGSRMYSNSAQDVVTETTASSTEDFSSKLEDKQNKIASAEDTFRFYDMNADGGRFSVKQSTPHEWTAAKAHADDTQIAAAQILLNLSRAN